LAWNSLAKAFNAIKSGEKISLGLIKLLFVFPGISRDPGIGSQKFPVPGIGEKAGKTATLGTLIVPK
jgi:hypothetical protein